MVEVNIETPDDWPDALKNNFEVGPAEYFSEMAPLFCNVNVPFEKIGKHMQEHVQENGLSKKPRRLLISGNKGNNLLLATPLLKWYLEHGLIITKIHEVIEFSRQNCFKDFTDSVTRARRQGDCDSDLEVLATTMKLIGNSGYGSLIMDKKKHQKIHYSDNTCDAQIKVNDRKFRRLEELEEGELFEIEMAKSRIYLDLPIQLGYFILQYAKLHMLKFYFDFMVKFAIPGQFEYLQMDTDSAYIALAGKTLLDIIRPDKLEEFKRTLENFCANEDVIPGECWFPRECCGKHKLHDKRTPGLFKVEFQGEEMISLCSKTYVASKKGDVKISSKGISKKNISNPMNIYREVLTERRPFSSKNKGFQIKKNNIYTYEQEREGFTYFYCKREVLDDGIHTRTLDIVLNPTGATETGKLDIEKLLMSGFIDGIY